MTRAVPQAGGKWGGPTQTAEDESLSCFLIRALSSCVRPSESDPEAVRGCSSDASARLQTDSFLLPDTAGFSLYPLGILFLHKRLYCFLPYMCACRSIAVACLFGDQLSPLIASLSVCNTRTSPVTSSPRCRVFTCMPVLTQSPSVLPLK